MECDIESITCAANLFFNDKFDEKLDLNEKYVASTTKDLGAEVSKIDFFKNPETIINDWVSKKTNGKINELISPDMLSGKTLLALVSAITFHGKWEEKFESIGKQDFEVLKNNTPNQSTANTDRSLDTSSPQPKKSRILAEENSKPWTPYQSQSLSHEYEYWPSKSNTKKVEFMESYSHHYSGSNFIRGCKLEYFNTEVVNIKYKDGLYMTIAMPGGDFDNFISGLTSEVMNQVFGIRPASGGSYGIASLKMPKFKFGVTIDLKQE